MTGPEHYTKAERLIDLAHDMADRGRQERADFILARAQVHVALAAVAANVGPWVAEGHDIGNPAPDEWARAIS